MIDIPKPLEYITKTAVFFGREFYVDQRVHIPRKNTEPLVRTVVDFLQKQPESGIVIVDIGTGAGVIAITIALETENISKIFATDYSSEILQVARVNIERYGLKSKITLLQGNLLEPLKEEKLDVIVANLPHASKDKAEKMNPVTKEYEPFNGYFGGETGLELYEQMFSQIEAFGKDKSLKGIFIKISPQHVTQLQLLHKKYLLGYKLQILKDEEGKVRIASFIK